jgi:hypothetical protein
VEIIILGVEAVGLDIADHLYPRTVITPAAY